jgi:hypothetical protein
LTVASSALHFSVGLTLGAALFLPGICRRWRCGVKLAPALRNWLIVSGLLGFWGILPSVLSRAGWFAEGREAIWTNVFLFYGLIEQAVPDHTYLAGIVILSALLVAQYGVLLAAIARARQRQRRL